jgi:hypothetical protein
MKSPHSSALRPSRFLAAARLIDVRRGQYACNALENGGRADLEISLFHHLYADNGNDECGYTDTIIGLHGTTFNGAHNWASSVADHRVMALCFAHWIARDLKAGKDVV